MAHPTKGHEARAATLGVEALELRQKGKSFREIGKELGVSYQTAHNYINKELAKLAEMRHDKTEELRELELARLDLMLTKLEGGIDIGDPKAINAALRIQEQRAKLLGLYAPSESNINLSGLSDAELIKLITGQTDSPRNA